MKKILLSTMLLCGLGLFTACESDRDSNPTLGSPTTFVLNTPSYASITTDLANSDSLTFTWSQPDYGGMPLQCEYQLEASLTGEFTTAYNADAEDNSGADYYMFEDYYNLCNGSLQAEDVATAMQILGNFEEDADFTTTPLYIRCSCYVPGSSSLSSSEKVYSNVISINTLPYYYELKAADPAIWYLTGGCIADGSWSNSEDAIGTGMLPMYPVYGNEYNRKDGTGVITYTGYFPANAEFKIIETPGNWNYGICGDGTDMGTSYRNGDDDTGNILIANEGYYTITVNTADKTCTIEALGSTPTLFSPMYMTGDFDGWAVSNAMTAMETWGSAQNHNWKAELDASGGDTTAKFTIEGWGSNWGATEFPYGAGVNNGSNIPVTAGNYTVYFNDITGQYYFISK